MSHYQGSSYRPGGDSYRPNHRQNHDGNGGGYDNARSGERGQGIRPHGSGRLPPQGSVYRGTGHDQRAYQNHQSNTSHTPSNTFKQGFANHRTPHMGGSGAPHRGSSFNHSNTHGYGGYNDHKHFAKQNFYSGSHDGRSPYGENNYKNQYGTSHQDGPKPFQQKRQIDTYHQAYSQTQADSQLWMGDLDPTWTENDILGIWAEVGEAPTNVKIMRDKLGKPQYSFVTFASSEAVANALQKNRNQVPGSSRYFKLNWASGSSHSDSRIQGNKPRQNPDGTKTHTDFSLFVGDLATEITEPELFNRFNQDYPGEVKQAKIMVDPQTGVSKGFGFIRFLSVDSQQKALKTMNGVVLGQRPIRLGLANGSTSDSSQTATRNSNEPSSASIHLSQPQPALTPFTDPYNTAITVKGIIPSITREELVAHFLPFGHIIYCKVDYSKNIAHIKYLLRSSAEKALLFMHGLIVNGSRLVLRWGRSRTSSEGIIRFAPAEKSGSYAATEKEPILYQTVPINFVFEDLQPQFFDQIKFLSDSKSSFAEDSDIGLQKMAARKKYLESAF